MSRASLLKVVAVIFLWIPTSTAFALYRTGPGPGLFDYLDQADQIIVGKAEKLGIVEIDGMLVNFEINVPIKNVATKLELVKFENSYLITPDGRVSIGRPIFLYVSTLSNIYVNEVGVYFLSHTSEYPNLKYSFSINENNNVSFHSEWDGNGLISYIKPLGHLEFIHHSEEGKRMSYDEFEHHIKVYLSKKPKELVSDSELLHSPEYGLKIIENIDDAW